MSHSIMSTFNEYEQYGVTIHIHLKLVYFLLFIIIIFVYFSLVITINTILTLKQEFVTTKIKTK